MLEAMLTEEGGATELHPCISNMVAKEMFLDVAPSNFTDDQKSDVTAASKGCCVGNLFLWLSDPTRFGDFILQLKDNYIHGVNNSLGASV
jgi:hypothetical protein